MLQNLIGFTHENLAAEIAEELGTADFNLEQVQCTKRESDGKLEYVYRLEYGDKVYHIIAADDIEKIIEL